jgi:Kef-type K+ transport system membrane component KefB
MTTIIFSAGLLMFLGFLGSRAVGIIKLPSITGYLLIGLLIGPSVFNVVTLENLSQLSHIVTPVVLGVISYMIGGSLPLSTIRGLKRNILVITAFESGFAWLFALLLITFLAPLLLPALSLDFKTALTMGIIIGGISLATAPAVTMAIIDELNVKGPLPSTLLGVVALDDALAIMAFAISIGVGAAILGDGTSASMINIVTQEVIYIGVSILMGLMLSPLLILASRFTRNRQELLVAILGIVIISSEISSMLNLFPLLTNMTLGFAVANIQKESEDNIGILKDIQAVMFSLFFSVAGAHLDLKVIESAGILAVVIIIGRSGGKFIGAWFGATISGAPQVVRKYLGLTLMPKAGVTVGLSLLVVETPGLEPISTLVVTGILASTLINELFTPPLSKFALMRAEKSNKTDAK